MDRVTPALRVLVLDDERISRMAMSQQLQDAGYVSEPSGDPFAALRRLDEAPWDVVLTDLRMPGMDGLAFLAEVKRRQPEVEVIVMTAYGTVETAVVAMRCGAADYLTKPFGFQELEIRLRRLAELRESRAEVRRLRALLDESGSVNGIVGRSSSVRRACERIQLFAQSVAPVLLTGETGTGKELVSRAIHDMGPRRTGSFVALGCGAIPRELAEAQLFGHEKGAFTGAVSRRRGLFEQAHEGTILLDDVDDLPLDIQVKLLRVLQEGTIRRVGGDEELAVDARVIATTKIDLETAVVEGRFRSDLLYRLRGFEIHLPPLRERGDDLLLLADHFLKILSAREKTSLKSLGPRTVAALRRHGWPGNVRELFRVMESASVLCRGQEIEPSHLPEYLFAARDGARPYALHLEQMAEINLHELLKQIEDDVIQWAMQMAQGQQSRAAEILGIPRTTLQSKMARPRRD